MKCNKCGTEFEEGIFCPECGTKYEVNNVLSDTSIEKARSILAEYNKEQREKEQVDSIYWSDAENLQTRIIERIEALKKLKGLGLKDEYAIDKEKKMYAEINKDYYKIQNEIKEGKTQRIVAIVLTFLSITVLFSFGIIGIIIGIILILSQWSAVREHGIGKNKKLLVEIDKLLNDIK